MKSSVTVADILKAEHELMSAAFSEFIGMTNKPGEDLQYLWGINELADKIIKLFEGEADG